MEGYIFGEGKTVPAAFSESLGSSVTAARQTVTASTTATSLHLGVWANRSPRLAVVLDQHQVRFAAVDAYVQNIHAVGRH